MIFYTPIITNRIKYTANYLLVKIIGVKNLEITDDFSKAEKSNKGVIHYGKSPVSEKFLFIPAHGLLEETGIRNVEPYPEYNGKFIELFRIQRRNQIDFDILSAVFYMVSRYEEYLPSIRDQYDRFNAKESIAYKYNFLEVPIVNIWAEFLKEKIVNELGYNHFNLSKYQYICTVDIDNAYAFKGKGIVRTIAAFFKSLFLRDIEEIYYRLNVLSGIKKDPYDTYEFLNQLHKKHNCKTIYFFLFANYAKNDKNLPLDSKIFIKLIKSISDFSEIGIHPSFQSNSYNELLEEEIKNLEKIIHKNIFKSRQHFLKLNFPQTYKKLIDADITEDYTMGFAQHIGFRAGTCTPYQFYDLDLEIETKLTIYPFQIMDATLNLYMKLKPKEAFEKICKIIDLVKLYNGTFITLWHNETLSNYKQWKGWRTLYEKTVAYASN